MLPSVKAFQFKHKADSPDFNAIVLVNWNWNIQHFRYLLALFYTKYICLEHWSNTNPCYAPFLPYSSCIFLRMDRNRRLSALCSMMSSMVLPSVSSSAGKPCPPHTVMLQTTREAKRSRHVDFMVMWVVVWWRNRLWSMGKGMIQEMKLMREQWELSYVYTIC